MKHSTIPYYIATAMVWLCGVAGVKAQPQGFTFNMITPRSFVVAGCNWPAMRTKPSAKAAKVAVKRAYKDDLFALAGAGNAKWYNIETVGAKGQHVSVWALKSLFRLLRVKSVETCTMPPAYEVEGPDGMGVVEGPDAHFQVREAGKYRMLPFTVGHPSGSDNWTVQFMVAGTDPSYTYVIPASFVVSQVADKKPSMSLERDVENGRVTYEVLYMNVPATVPAGERDSYIMSYLQECPDAEFAKIVSVAIPADGRVRDVALYFKGSDGRRHVYRYDGSLPTSCAYSTFRWEFKE